ncbi:MAG: metallophosphoesterase [Kofleriaceae bacterium]
MTRWALGALVVAALVVSARADDQDDPATGDGSRAAGEPLTGRVLVAPGARWDVAWAAGPALTAALGPTALAALDHVAGGPPPASVFGAAPPPAGWPLALTPTATGPAPIGPLDCRGCGTRLPGRDGERIAAVWAVTAFSLTAADRDLRVLELRTRYRDGLAVWLNGVPVVRRSLPGADPLAIAARPHGPEWETVFVPVVPGLLRVGTNRLAVEVRPAGHTRAPTVEVELAGRPQARIVRGPMLGQVTPSAATVVVETDLPTAASLAWGTGALDRVAAAPPGVRRQHVFALAGLPPEATITYQLTIDGVVGPPVRFATAPGPGDVVRIGIYGDVRGGHRVHAALVDRLVAEAPDAVLASGDLVLRGADEADWQQFFAVTAPLIASIPYYPAVGNHDLGRAGDLARRFVDHFALPPGPSDRPPGAAWYSFELGDVHVVMLDSNAYDDARQRAWLEADLRAADGARAIIAVTHDGPFSRGTHGGNQQAVRDYVPILVRHRVTLLVSGHDHLYQRGRQDGLAWVVSGGGGAPLYRVRCGVAGRPRCARPDGLVLAAREHHYLLLTVFPAHVEVCPRRADGAAIEPCFQLPTRR